MDAAHNIIGFEFEPDSHASVHHVLVFGCQSRSHPRRTPQYECFEPCPSGRERLMWGWALNGSNFQMPDGIGFSVGPGTHFQSISLQLHFLKPSATPDYSALLMRTTKSPLLLQANIAIFAPGSFQIPPRKSRFDVSAQCCYSGTEPVLGFAFRVHAHILSRHVQLERFRYENGKWARLVIAGRNSQLPQEYNLLGNNANQSSWGEAPSSRLLGQCKKHGVRGSLTAETCASDSLRMAQNDGGLVALHTLLPGDVLKATCTYDSSERDTVTYEGWRHTDEMCNFYLMHASMHTTSLLCEEDPASDDLTEDPQFDFTEDSQESPHHSRDAVTFYSRSRVLDKSPTLFKSSWWSTAGGNDTAAAIGQVGGLATDSARGILYIFHRGSRKWGRDSFSDHDVFNQKQPAIKEPAVTAIDIRSASRRIITQWGADMFYMPHGATFVDGLNPCLWLTDVGMHLVFKFTVSGELLHTLGTPMVPGKSRTHFCKPTSVAIDPSSGMVFVADGYCNKRIVRFHPSGVFDREWSLEGTDKASFARAGSMLPYRDFRIPHSLVWGDCGELRVADREHGAIHSYTKSGEYRWTWDLSMGVRDHQGPCSIYAPVSYTHLRAHETVLDLVCRLLLEKKK
eukprot:TRINITY_DN3196_c0_g1_i8.p1 TRINITY_DN3196_c0_g1~~TRINITY_DN3196_c0_g1_i8.p1  ORF type:complete len:625 (-),score=27.94 TRINITY_DN3196_c0_g1_i8:31-1905(-)